MAQNRPAARTAVIAVAIDSIAAGGDGVGHLPDGRAVFVPRTAPGDVAEILLTEEKPRYARGRLSRLAQPSPLRVEPECPHYTQDRCGGCQLQHLSLEAQREAKGRVVRDALRRIGGVGTPETSVVPSPTAWRYRAKLTLAVRGEIMGLHRQGDPDAVFALVDCRITSQPLMDLWQSLRTQRDKLPADLHTLVLRQDRDGGRHVIASAGSARWNAGPLAAVLGPGVSLWWQPEGGAARVVAGSQTGFPATAFEQINPGLANRIREDAVGALGEVDGRVVWDLYGGLGDTARQLAARGARVWSVDADRSAIEWARKAGGPITYLAARVEDAVAKLPTPDAAMVNPPRTGLHERVATQIGRSGAAPGRLAYVSCDPATLARDLKRLGPFKLTALVPYDLFPQTAHVETLAMLEAA